VLEPVYVRQQLISLWPTPKLVWGDIFRDNILGSQILRTFRAKAHGAVIGKAMTGLAQGKGLVLALVTLQ
jgi:hypothetical protein